MQTTTINSADDVFTYFDLPHNPGLLINKGFHVKVPELEELILLGMPADLERVTVFCAGYNFHPRFKDYYVHFFGLVNEHKAQNIYKGNIVFKLVPSDNSEPSVCSCWRHQIVMRNVKAHILSIWTPDGWDTSINGIEAIECGNIKQYIRGIQQLTEGLMLVKNLPDIAEILRVKGGRPKDSGLIREGNKWQALDYVRQKAKEIYFSGEEFSMHRVARACGGRYGIKAEGDSCIDRCGGCKAIYELIKKCNTDGTWDSEVSSHLTYP